MVNSKVWSYITAPWEQEEPETRRRCTPAGRGGPKGNRSRVTNDDNRSPLTADRLALTRIPPCSYDIRPKRSPSARRSPSTRPRPASPSAPCTRPSGIHNCFPHSHGSQGCCAYHRSMLTRHYKEPVMAGTSSFTEGASVFGGMANLNQAINNIFTLYEPDVIAVHTTCLSEVIGDDIPQIASSAKDAGKVPEGKYVIHANTPSFVGSHVTGFSTMTKALVDYFSEPSGGGPAAGQPDPRLRGALRHGRDQAHRRRAGRRQRDVPGHLGRAQRPPDRPPRVLPPGWRHRGCPEDHRRQPRHPGHGRLGLRSRGHGPGEQVPGAAPDARPAHRADGHRPFRGRPAQDGRGEGARVDQHRARPAAGSHDRHGTSTSTARRSVWWAIRTS